MLLANNRWTILLTILVFLIGMSGFENRLPRLGQLTLVANSLLFLGVVGATDRRTWLRTVMAVPVAVWFVLVVLSEVRPGPQVNVLMVTTSAVLLFGCMIIGFRQLFARNTSGWPAACSAIC